MDNLLLIIVYNDRTVEAYNKMRAAEADVAGADVAGADVAAEAPAFDELVALFNEKEEPMQCFAGHLPKRRTKSKGFYYENLWLCFPDEKVAFRASINHLQRCLYYPDDFRFDADKLPAPERMTACNCYVTFLKEGCEEWFDTFEDYDADENASRVWAFFRAATALPLLRDLTPEEAEEAKAQQEEEEKKKKEARKAAAPPPPAVPEHTFLRTELPPLYDTVAFENELYVLFSPEEAVDEMWLVSPWIGKTFSKPFRFKRILSFLGRGGRCFVAYSPRIAEEEQPEIAAEAEASLFRLRNEYPGRFYLIRRPAPSHVKEVIAVRKGETILFSGSFNVLSFGLDTRRRGLTDAPVRDERMVRVDNQAEAEREKERFLGEFAQAYLDQARDDVDRLDPAEAASYNNPALTYFTYYDALLPRLKAFDEHFFQHTGEHYFASLAEHDKTASEETHAATTPAVIELSETERQRLALIARGKLVKEVIAEHYSRADTASKADCALTIASIFYYFTVRYANGPTPEEVETALRNFLHSPDTLRRARAKELNVSLTVSDEHRNLYLAINNLSFCFRDVTRKVLLPESMPRARFRLDTMKRAGTRESNLIPLLGTLYDNFHDELESVVMRHYAREQFLSEDELLLTIASRYFLTLHNGRWGKAAQLEEDVDEFLSIALESPLARQLNQNGQLLLRIKEKDQTSSTLEIFFCQKLFTFDDVTLDEELRELLTLSQTVDFQTTKWRSARPDIERLLLETDRQATVFDNARSYYRNTTPNDADEFLRTIAALFFLLQPEAEALNIKPSEVRENLMELLIDDEMASTLVNEGTLKVFMPVDPDDPDMRQINMEIRGFKFSFPKIPAAKFRQIPHARCTLYIHPEDLEYTRASLPRLLAE